MRRLLKILGAVIRGFVAGGLPTDLPKPREPREES